MNSDLNLTEREELSRLRAENETLRNAVKACEACDGPTMEEVKALREENERLKQPLPKWCVDLAELFNRTAIEERDKAKHELREVKAENERLKVGGYFGTLAASLKGQLTKSNDQIKSLAAQLAERDAEIGAIKEAFLSLSLPYINSQFPATIGHIPLQNWFKRLEAALSRTKPAEEKE